MTERNRGPWIQTYTGKQMHPFDARPEEICVEDVAHALSLEGRWGGHTKRFFPVALHAINVSIMLERWKSKLLAYAGLHHDDSEAYLRDIPTPLKRTDVFYDYRFIETRLQRACDHFFACELWTVDERELVRDADAAMLAVEAQELLPGGALGWDPGPLDPEALRAFRLTESLTTPTAIEHAFLERHHRLRKELDL